MAFADHVPGAAPAAGAGSLRMAYDEAAREGPCQRTLTPSPRGRNSQTGSRTHRR